MVGEGVFISAVRSPTLGELRALDATIRYNIRLATSNNVMGTSFYSSVHAPSCIGSRPRRSPARRAGPRRLALYDAIKPQAERYARLYVRALLDEIVTSVEEHATLIRHVEAGDAMKAERALETNWRNAAARLATVIGTLGERGSW